MLRTEQMSLKISHVEKDASKRVMFSGKKGGDNNKLLYKNQSNNDNKNFKRKLSH